MKIAYVPASVMKKWIRPQSFVHHPPEHLRHPIIGRGENPEDRRHAHDQVEVSDHEIGVVQVNVKHRLRRGRCRSARPKQTATRSRWRTASGVWKRILPFHIVPSQLNVLIAEGTPIHMVSMENAIAE